MLYQFILLLLTVCFKLSHGAGSTMQQLSQNDINEILKWHNKYRQDAASGQFSGQPPGNIPPLSWDTEVAQHAYKYLDGFNGGCPSDHNPHKCWYHGSMVEALGENIAWGPNDIEDRITNWVKEYVNYTYSKEPAQMKCNPADPHCQVGHYTQVVWSRTTKVGCAIKHNCGKYDMMLLCNYAAAGNMKDEYPYYPAGQSPAPKEGSMDECQYPEYQKGNWDPWKKELKDRAGQQQQQQPHEQQPSRPTKPTWGQQKPETQNPWGQQKPETQNPWGQQKPQTQNPWGPQKPQTHNPWGPQRPQTQKPSWRPQRPQTPNPNGRPQNPWGGRPQQQQQRPQRPQQGQRPQSNNNIGGNNGDDLQERVCNVVKKQHDQYLQKYNLNAIKNHCNRYSMGKRPIATLQSAQAVVKAVCAQVEKSRYSSSTDFNKQWDAYCRGYGMYS